MMELYEKLSIKYPCAGFTYGFICNCDARDGFKYIPSGYVDSIVTDPPWGLGFDQYDDPNVFFELEDEYYRVLKDNAWFLFFYSIRDLPRAFSLKKLEYVWMIPYLYITMNTITRNRLGSQQAYGIILVFKKGNPRIRVKRRDVIISDELPIVTENVKEPQFKPTGAVASLLMMFTSREDIVLDPYAGYGSIPLVCELYGRKWIAFEIDPVKYKIAEHIIRTREVKRIDILKNTITS